jgi:hypothetical protein
MNPSGRHGSGRMGGYSPEEREQLPSSDFLKPETRGWPVSDKRHAEIALRYMAWGRGNRSEYPKLLERLFAIPRYENDKGLRQLYERLKPQIEARMARKNPYYSGPDTRTEAELQAIEAQILGPAARTNPYWTPGMGSRSAWHRSEGTYKGDKPFASARRRAMDQEMVEEGMEDLGPRAPASQGSLRASRARVEADRQRLRDEFEEQRWQASRPSPPEPSPYVQSEYRKRKEKRAVTYDAPLSGRGPLGRTSPSGMASFELMPGGPLPGGGYRPSITVIHDVELQPQRAKVRHLSPVPDEEIKTPAQYTTKLAKAPPVRKQEFRAAKAKRDQEARELEELQTTAKAIRQRLKDADRALQKGQMSEVEFFRQRAALQKQAERTIERWRSLKLTEDEKAARDQEIEYGGPLAEAEMRSAMIRHGVLDYPDFERPSDRKYKQSMEDLRRKEAAERAGIRTKVAPSPFADVKDSKVRQLYAQQWLEDHEDEPFMGDEALYAQEEITEPLDTDWMYHEGHEEFAKENPDQSGILFEYIGRYSSLEPIYDERKLFEVRDTSGRLDLAASAKQALQHLRETRRAPPSIMTLFEDGRRVRELRESDLLELSNAAKSQRNPWTRASRKNPDAPFEGILVEWHGFNMTSSWPLTTTQYRAADRAGGGMAVAAQQAVRGIQEAVKQGSPGANYSYVIKLVEPGSKPLTISLDTLKQLAKRGRALNNPGVEIPYENMDVPFEGILLEWKVSDGTDRTPRTITGYAAPTLAGGDGMALAAQEALAWIEGIQNRAHTGIRFNFLQIKVGKPGSDKPTRINLDMLKKLAKR